MVNYQNGKIYKIESIEGDCVYYGSSCGSLPKRMAKHRYNYKINTRITSGQILCFDDAKIYLVEKYPCNTKEELLAREGYYIKNNDCVNRCIAGRTHKEYYLDNKEKRLKQNKERYQDNKTEILKERKKYYNKNRDKTLDNVKKYYEKNKQNKIEYASKYRDINKEKLKNIASSRIICDCGMDIRFGDRRRHERTKYHLTNIKI